MAIIRKLFIGLGRILAGTLLAAVILVLCFQDRLIYHPHPYTAGEVADQESLLTLQYQTAQGAQKAYYLRPRTNPDQPPQRLWVLCPGNGSLACDWTDFIRQLPDAGDGYLMIEYPGYGASAGTPSPVAIESSAEAAFQALAEQLHVKPADLDRNINILCHSLGCATGLNFAVRHPVKRVILAAPFTSLLDMARRTVGEPLCRLLLHNYDNRARLRDLAADSVPPRVIIFHGSGDEVIPVGMGRELASLYPAMIEFHEVRGADHNSVIGDAQPEIIAAMRD